MAAADAVVVHAGPVADRAVVSLLHTGGLRTTYEPVTPAVRRGQPVRRGDRIGALDPGHEGCPTETCLHWGAFRTTPPRSRTYLNPLHLVSNGRVRLLPRTDARAPHQPPDQPLLSARTPTASSSPHRAPPTRLTHPPHRRAQPTTSTLGASTTQPTASPASRLRAVFEPAGSTHPLRVRPARSGRRQQPARRARPRGRVPMLVVGVQRFVGVPGRPSVGAGPVRTPTARSAWCAGAAPPGCAVGTRATP
ncbi:peptidoglycan DD-metalloendopeptidase family protein [Actinosynnema sp. CA-299493]